MRQCLRVNLCQEAGLVRGKEFLGQQMSRQQAKRNETVVVYRGHAGACNACSLNAVSTDSIHGRTFQRSIYAE